MAPPKSFSQLVAEHGLSQTSPSLYTLGYCPPQSSALQRDSICCSGKASRITDTLPHPACPSRALFPRWPTLPSCMCSHAHVCPHALNWLPQALLLWMLGVLYYAVYQFGHACPPCWEALPHPRPPDQPVALWEWRIQSNFNSELSLFLALEASPSDPFLP